MLFLLNIQGFQIPEENIINVEDEDSIEAENEIERIPMGKPQMKMVDFPQVKLREFKKPTNTNPTSSSQSSGGKPSWLEELSKKQANRKSVEIGEQPQKKEKFSRSQSEDKEDKVESRNTGQETSSNILS